LAEVTRGFSIFGANLVFVGFAAVFLFGAATLVYRAIIGIAVTPIADGVLVTRFLSRVPVAWSDIRRVAIKTDQPVPYLQLELVSGKKLKCANLVDADARAFEAYARDRLAG
jgi:hypothetical protein